VDHYQQPVHTPLKTNTIPHHQEKERTQRTFRNPTLQTRIKRIATKQRHQLRLTLILPTLSTSARVRITQRLKPRHATYGFARAGLDVVDVVVVQDAQVGRSTGGVGAFAGLGDALCRCRLSVSCRNLASGWIWGWDV